MPKPTLSSDHLAVLRRAIQTRRYELEHDHAVLVEHAGGDKAANPFFRKIVMDQKALKDASAALGKIYEYQFKEKK